MSAGHLIAIDIDQYGDPLNAYIRLFDSAGRQLDFNDDGPFENPPHANESYLEYAFREAGTYYIGVSAYRNTAYNPVSGTGDSDGLSTGRYQLRLTRLA